MSTLEAVEALAPRRLKMSYEEYLFDASWLWQEELPNPQLILAEIMVSIPDLAPEIKETYQALHKLLSK